jgi:sRNA-binding protein
MSSFIQTNSQETASSAMNINTARIEVGGSVDGKINLTQRIDLTKEVSGKLSQQSLDSLKAAMDTALQNVVQQAAEATASTGGGAAVTQNDVEINQTIQSITSQTTQLSNYNKLVDETLNKNDGTIVIKGNVGKNADISIDQGIVAKIIVKNVLDSVATQMMDNTTISSIMNSAEQTATSTSKNLLDNLFEGIASIFGIGADVAKTWIIGCVIVLCVLCGGLLAFMLSPAGQEATTTAVSAGANIAKARYG